MKLDNKIRTALLTFQQNEISEHHIYMTLARKIKPGVNREILEKIGQDEFKHYEQLKKYTERDVAPSKLKIRFFYFISRVFGITFGIKLMERGEEKAQKAYENIVDVIPKIKSIIEEENEHESRLLELLDEERLKYTGSIVLGLNDALVELTGALAGLTLALQRTRLIALTGLIIGIAATLSMAASEYLSTKSEETVRNPVKASFYTGAAYLSTVIILISPYLILDNYFVCLACTIIAAILIIAFFNYYIAIVDDVSFKSRFLEMALLSFGVATLSFFIGYLIRTIIGLDI